MKSIRLNTFETNSSSLHAITFACKLKNKELYKEYVEKELKRWLQPDGTYLIEIECSEDSVDDGQRFDIRRYIPHFSINDKLVYLLATVIQHFGSEMVYPPYDPSKYVTGWWENKYSKNVKEGKVPTKEEIDEVAKKKAEKHEEYLKDYDKWLKENAARNEEALKDFKEKIERMQSYIASELNYVLFGNYQDPKVRLIFKYSTKDGVINYTSNDSDYFSTGCYGNEEFYSAVNRDPGSWIVNPYSAVLAGSDEQSSLDYYLQEQKAKECLEESYKNGYSTYDEEEIEYIEDDIRSKEGSEKDRKDVEKVLEEIKSGKIKKPNEGKIIYPIGG